MPSFACVFYLVVTSQAFWALGAANAKDSTRLVRKSVSAWQTFQFEKPQMGAKVQDVLREFQDLARVGVSPEPEKIRTIKSIVDDELLPDLQAVHDAAAKQVGINLAAIDQCNKNALGRLEEVKGTTEVSVGKERTDHATCREEEKNKNNTKGDKCAELDNFLAGVNVPADLPAGRARDEMVAYVKTMSVYFCHKGPDVTDLDDACDKATAEHAKHKAACDKLQAIFELGFCTWRTELIDTCAALSTCYASATKIYNGHVSDTKELVKKWKVEYGALKKILCYVEVWLSDNNVQTANADQLQKCESSNIDTSPMDIDFGTPAEQAKCPLTAVENFPGTPGFVTTEYANFNDYVNQVIPCLIIVEPIPVKPTWEPQIVAGRPYTTDYGAAAASVQWHGDTSTCAWSTAASSGLADYSSDLTQKDAAIAAEEWLVQGRDEHASIASFSRVSLDLMRFEAPPNIIEATHAAAIDEIRHAKLSFDLASRFRQQSNTTAHGLLVEVGQFPISTVALTSSISELASRTLQEGCIGESSATARVAFALSALKEGSPAKDLSKMIFSDEARHAALAWATVHWAVQKGAKLDTPQRNSKHDEADITGSMTPLLTWAGRVPLDLSARIDALVNDVWIRPWEKALSDGSVVPVVKASEDALGEAIATAANLVRQELFNFLAINVESV